MLYLSLLPDLRADDDNTATTLTTQPSYPSPSPSLNTTPPSGKPPLPPSPPPQQNHLTDKGDSRGSVDNIKVLGTFKSRYLQFRSRARVFFVSKPPVVVLVCWPLIKVWFLFNNRDL
ncbi:hypothetical protein HanRHA438_Chr03g0108471 [Helianthus annuus]|uniref:Uncharacterized protein n=1 Tax=Helianthus annuus TaxID=4232 RepID=A0A251V6A4_HELAN|nr:hypothetical protein HanXRQr2_Chr03g0097431 [Helianthus annuus]KAJ0592122.1 hypothetical protein HanHA300_Chr03g0081201 [Helianthus annuus]KAJ0599561.1 hypothetical protein HanIR_Chr03g0106271 [Helianthus annuus]KAJ0607104.1 hypothetical protein HanHA89_Chr03g0092651 [Helianthus annuus]KAJ0767157.1 hypothetical protein HanLR1_Chr03g0085871 [Helianthus annuus]